MPASHAPGPWVVKGEPGLTLCVTDRDSAHVVDRFLLGGRPPEEHLANAKLIAAAPDLLAALRDLLRETDEGQQLCAEKFAAAARAAVARATGQE